MEYNEILLIIAIVALFTVPPLLFNDIKGGMKTFAELTIGLVLLILVWFFTGDGSLPLKIIVTAMVIKNSFVTFKNHKNFENKHKA